MVMWRIPKVRMAGALFILSILAIWRFFSPELIFRLFAVILFAIILEYLLWQIRKVQPFVPRAGIVTALIIFLLSNPQSPFWLTLLAVLVAIAGKQLFRFHNSHTLNPAAAGLLTAGLLGLPITWWGVSWGTIPLILTILLTGFVSLYTIKQHRIIIPFLLTTLLMASLLFGPQTAINQLLVGSFWFFTLVMLPEPQTAARYPNTRLIYGTLIALLTFLIPLIKLPVDPLLASLLVGNITARVIEDNLIRKVFFLPH